MSREWTPPSWWYVANKPSSDVAYFANLTRCIFQAGLNWQVIDKKWPNFIRAFNDFNISKIALYDEEDFNRLSEDTSIVRNKKKILATIHNAKEFQRIVQEFGSFSKWLDSLDKSNNYAAVVTQLMALFNHVGKMTAHTFLHSVGEAIEHEESLFGPQP
jgi:3-methyladenine DNA glycosylase Tag